MKIIILLVSSWNDLQKYVRCFTKIIKIKNIITTIYTYAIKKNYIDQITEA